MFMQTNSRLQKFKKVPFRNDGMVKLVCPCRIVNLGQ